MNVKTEFTNYGRADQGMKFISRNERGVLSGRDIF